ncbi:hypothetical protein J2739_004168 [Variovorax soli]|uniref:Uncharacterized protein n=1 Tax=Variovorax soli TaxID=376815 RepID=A0ABU1NIV3_9BURK|nr:hypothetical protein [Variovorax soli]
MTCRCEKFTSTPLRFTYHSLTVIAERTEPLSTEENIVAEKKTPFDVLGTHPFPQEQWRCAFVSEWARLSEGCADQVQTAEAAEELYARYGARNPTEVAREEWGDPS